MNWTEYLHLLAGLMSVVNPIGVIPIFISLTVNRTLADRIQTAFMCAFSVATVLLVALFAGQPILQFFGIGLPAFRVAGGLLVLLMGISMLNASADRVRHTPEERAESYEKDSIAVVPLAIPLLSGPGAISTAIVYGQTAPSTAHFVLVALVILTVSVMVLIALLAAPKIADVMGRTGMNVVTRVMGLLIVAIAVEFIAKGLTELFPVLATVA